MRVERQTFVGDDPRRLGTGRATGLTGPIAAMALRRPPLTFRLARAVLAAGLFIALMGAVSPVVAAKRIALYGAHGEYSGYAVVQRREGRVDYYDARERRVGWARANRFSDHYRVDLFGANGLARGYAIVDRDAGQVEFFDPTSRLVGSGLMDNRGRVTGTDLAGRRRDTVLPMTPRSRSALQGPPSD